MSKKDIYLSQFYPRSELVVERQIVEKPKFPVIDVHAHFGPMLLGENYAEKYDTGEEVEKLKKLGIRGIVNLETLWGDALDKMLEKIRPYDDFIYTFGSVDVQRLDDPDFESHVVNTLKDSKEKGIKGLKLWKNLSLGMKDKNGKYVPVDDDRLSVIWETAAELDLPILIHIADPVAFFRPIDEKNERFEELQNHPDWSFCAPDLFSFEELMSQQENMIRKNPKTTFIIAHCGSYSENLGFVSDCLDKYPNMYVDIAARLAELGRQPYTSRKFFHRHQDRILFGIDAGAGHYAYQPYFEFLETWNEYFDYTMSGRPGQGRWRIYGIGLEDEILKKVYYENAEKVLRLK